MHPNITTTISALLLLIIFGGSTLFAQEEPEEITPEQMSENLGKIMGNNLKSQGFEGLDPGIFSEAMKKALETEMSEEELDEANKVVTQYLSAQKEKQYATVKVEGEQFLTENAKKEGVNVTESGLQYKVLEEGTGPTPSATDEVVVHYHGTTIDGSVFDSSVERGEPASFPVNRVIDGWQEALQMMPVGAKWKIFLPYDIAYGERGAGDDIKPYETLIFEVELIEIK